MIPTIVILDNSEDVLEFKKQMARVPIGNRAIRETLAKIVDSLHDFEIAHVGLLDCVMRLKERYSRLLSETHLKIFMEAVVRFGLALIKNLTEVQIALPGTGLPYRYYGLFDDNVLLTYCPRWPRIEFKKQDPN